MNYRGRPACATQRTLPTAIAQRSNAPSNTNGMSVLDARRIIMPSPVKAGGRGWARVPKSCARPWKYKEPAAKGDPPRARRNDVLLRCHGTA